MAKIVTITNPLTGQPAQVDQLDHTAQQIDDGLNIARGVSNPNLLDNWYFGNPVNQRGISSQNPWPSNAYGIDRWIQYGSGASLENGYVYFPAGVVPTQNLDPNLYDSLLGKVVTFSYLMSDGTLVTGTSTVLDGATTMLVNNPDGQSYLTNAVGVQFYRNTSFGCVAAKLELGTTQTLAHQDENGVWQLNEIPDYGEQLARCQRELYRDGGSDYTSVGYGLAETGKTAYFLVKLPVPMRVRPSVTYAGNWTVWDGVTGRAIESISINSVATNPKDCSFVNIKVDIAGSDLTIGKMYQLCVRSDKSAYIEFIC